ncbi:MAG: aryl-sulfate sulfotransferase [Candidatus Edwardsbacteria bacterium]|nr:aryl-sulfate sulfotransferase [Candidatus Edwardsbacteria bacterium]
MLIKKMSTVLLVNITVLLLSFLWASAEDRTVGLMVNDTIKSFEGYTLFSPMGYKTTYLIDNNGELINSWPSVYLPGLSSYLLDNGKLLLAGRVLNNHFSLAGGSGGVIQLINWDGTVHWEYKYADSTYQSHHDVRMLPNGNILMIAWELKSRDEAIAAGRDSTLLISGELWPEHIIEVQPIGQDSGDIVWEWHVWDHLIQDIDSIKPNYGIVADHPELININFIGLESSSAADWIHLNSIDYNQELDQIVVSSREFDEIWIIDHGTTTAEAASHSGGIRGRGGDLLFRWGNPYAYNRGTLDNHVFFGQHNANWITDGFPGAKDILVFNNGLGRDEGNYSSIDQIKPAFDTISGTYQFNADSSYVPSTLAWNYISTPVDIFFSPYISGATRQPNGNTLICSGWGGTFIEVTPDGETVWEYINPVIISGPMTQGDTIPGIGFFDGKENMVFRIYRYAPDYPGLLGQNLTPQGPIEIYTSGVANDYIRPASKDFVLYQNTPNPFKDITKIKYQVPVAGTVNLKIYNIMGQEIRKLCNKYETAGIHTISWDGKDNRGNKVANNILFYRLEYNGIYRNKRMVRIN